MIIIPKGSVVTILMADSVFQGTQGILEEDAADTNHKVMVRFGKEYSYLFGWDFSEATAIVEFPAGELKREEDFTLENRVKRLFGRNMWHSIYKLPESFDAAAGKECQGEGCKAKAVRRILVNIWGSVCEYDVCQVCGDRFHGKLVDGFPAKKNDFVRA